jgi:nucleoid DNA-binding protein
MSDVSDIRERVTSFEQQRRLALSRRSTWTPGFDTTDHSRTIRDTHMAKKSAAISSPLNKSQILADISGTTGIAKRDVGKVLEELNGVIERHIGKKGPGSFTLPGLFKIKTIKKPATKARKGINPFTKEEVTFKAKPARTVIKIRPLKKLKDFV